MVLYIEFNILAVTEYLLSSSYTQKDPIDASLEIEENGRTDSYFWKYHNLLSKVCSAMESTSMLQKITFVSLIRESEPLRFFREKGYNISKKLWSRAKQYLNNNATTLGKIFKSQAGRPTKMTPELLDNFKFFLKRRDITRVSPNLRRQGKKIRYLENSFEITFKKYCDEHVLISDSLFRKILKKHFPYVFLHY